MTVEKRVAPIAAQHEVNNFKLRKKIRHRFFHKWTQGVGLLPIQLLLLVVFTFAALALLYYLFWSPIFDTMVAFAGSYWLVRRFDYADLRDLKPEEWIIVQFQRHTRRPTVINGSRRGTKPPIEIKGSILVRKDKP